MRICYLSRILPLHEPGGMQEHLWSLASGVAQRGHEVHVISTAAPPGARAPDSPVQVHLLEGTIPGKYRKGFFNAALKRFRELDQERPFDLVHSASFAGWAFPGRVAVPLVATLHGVSLAETEYEPHVFASLNPKRKLKSVLRFPKILYITRVMLKFATRADAILVDSQFSKRELRRVQPRVSEDAIRVVYCGIDTKRFAPNPEAEARAALGLPAGPLAVAVSRLDPQKGVQVALAAFAELADTDIRLVVAGDGSYRAYLEAQAERRGLANVTFIGRASDEDLPRYYAAADVFVYPELTQPAFGLVAAEAMACGTAVVASNHGAIPEVVGDAGRLFPPGDAHALADEIRDFFGHENPRDAGAAARKRVQTLFPVERMIDETLSLYENMAGRRGP